MVRARSGRTLASVSTVVALASLLLVIGLTAPNPALATSLPDTDGMNELTASSPRLSFGNVAVGTTNPFFASETMTNQFSDDMITFSSVVLTGGFEAEYNCLGTLGPLSSCFALIACTPTKTGYRFGVMAFFYTSADTSPEIDPWDSLPKATFVGLYCTGMIGVSGTAIQDALQNGMNGAAITLVKVNPDGSDGSTLASTTADANGNFSMLTASAQAGPVRVRASGGSYPSENGATVTSPSPLSVLLPNLQNSHLTLSVNPLTTFVDSLAQGNISRGQTLATALSNSTASIEHDYGISADPSTLTPLLFSLQAGTDRFRLGLILGALVNEDDLACPGDLGGLVTALSGDISDGVLDGRKSGAAISYCGGNLDAIAGTAQFSDALSGLQQLALATSGFTYGGFNGVTAAEAEADAATIEGAIVAAVPPSVSAFAATTPGMTNARYYSTATLLPNGKVLIAGGNTPGPLTSTELYDPISNAFAPSPPTMNHAHLYSTATLLPNGKVLIAGGWDSSGNSSSSTELYDSVTNTFAGAASTPVMNAGRSYATATLLPNGKVLIAGGSDNVSVLSSTELYDPATNTFAASTPTMNAARYEATATLLTNGKVLLAGGADFGGALSSTELYDPAANTFAASPTMNSARQYPTATLLPNGKVLIAGGFGSAGILSSAELYDPVTNTFAAAPAMNSARGNATATLLPNGKMLIAGGTANGFAPLNSTELYDPVANTFAASTPAMNVGRENATATLLPNGKVLIAGGQSNNAGYVSSTELYTP